MKTIESLAGEHIRDACANALKLAQETNEPVQFTFSGKTITAEPTHSIGDIYAQWGSPILSAEEECRQAKEWTEKQEREWAEAIAAAGVMTEQQMRDSTPPWPKTIEELTAYITSLVERPHDYGTCVYAMSLAAVAAYHYAAHKVGATGFQAGCADMDILRRTRSLKAGFRLINYEDLLYPQYWNAKHFPTALDLLSNLDVQKWAVAEAKKKLAETPDAHPACRAHWERIANMGAA